MKIVLDTNILVSGIFFSGFPSKILNAWSEGEVEFSLSPEILDEYIRVTTILSDNFRNIDVSHIINFISSHSDIVQTEPFSDQVCDDPDDDKFLACALAARSMIVVSGDKHLLKISGYRGIIVMTPRSFVEKYLTNRT